jgi:anti-sigma-K factor RskA
MSSAHVTENIPAYALGILEGTERAEITLHLESCPACREELRTYQVVVDQLPMAVTQRTPPRRLRAAILQAAAAQAEETRKQRSGLLSWFTRPVNSLVGLIGLVLIVVLGAFNIYQWQQARQAAVQTVTTFSDFRLVAMVAPNTTGQNTSGVLVINQPGTLGTLVVDGLTKLDPSQQYQMWLIKDGVRTSGGVFSVFGSGYGYLYIRSPEPLGSYTSFGVTIEPAGGSPGPTGEKVLGGNL